MGLLATISNNVGRTASSLNTPKTRGLLGSLVRAANDAIGSTTYLSAQNRRVGQFEDPEKAIMEAQRMGRFDLIPQLQAQIRARQEAAQAQQGREAQAEYSRIMFPNMPNAKSSPMPSPAASNQAPMAQVPTFNPAQNESNAAQQAAIVPPLSNSPAAAMSSLPNNQAGETVVVNGIRNRMPNAPRNPFAEAQQYEQLSQAAAARGRGEEALDFRRKAVISRQNAENLQNQIIAGLIAPIARIGGNEEQINAFIDTAVTQARVNYGIQLDPMTLEGLRNPQSRSYTIQTLVNQGNPEDAAKKEIDTQSTYQQFRPLQTDNLGDRQGVFDPRTGRYVSSERFGLNPTQVRGQDITSANNRASVGASIANNRRSTGVAQQGVNLRKQEYEYNRSIGVPSNAGRVNNNFEDEGW